MWAVQDNLINEEDRARLYRALEKVDVVYKKFTYIPFSDVLPDVPKHSPTIFYGATRVVGRVWQSQEWHPVRFGDPNDFNIFNYFMHYKEDFLNSDFMTGVPVNLFETVEKDPQEYFVRPHFDDKPFAGRVYTPEEVKKWSEGYPPSPDVKDYETPIMWSSPKRVDNEYRLFVVDGVVVAGSRYRKNNRLNTSPSYDMFVKRWVEQEIHPRWSPADVYVIDVGVVNDTPYVIECNSFNSSGFYESNVEDIVRAVEQHFYRVYY